MKTLAVCFYGDVLPSVDTMHSVFEKFKHYQISMFTGVSERKTQALLKSAFDKRKVEISKMFEFDICLAIDSSASELIKYTAVTPGYPNTIYFTKGFYKHSTMSTGVNPSVFYGRSLTFDRACEFDVNLNHINYKWLRGNTLEELFHYHLKSLDIRTRCINRENSDMFIRTT